MKLSFILLKEIIKKCEILRIKGNQVNIYDLIEEVPIPNLSNIVNHIQEDGYLDGRLHPTSKGRNLIKVGLTGGTFDIIHIGHLKTLHKAKEEVDVLAVVVARDKTVRMFKKREPLNNENIRLEIVSMLKPVDIAILGSEEDFIIPVKRVNPDIIFLGYDQELPDQLKNRLKEIEIKKLDVYYAGYKSSKVIKKLLNMLGY